jgi:RNA-directed DNA polymerase
MERFLLKRLKLRVNRGKSTVARYHERGFLGFGFTRGKNPKIKLTDKSLMSFKDRIREITRRSRGIPLVQIVEELSVFLRGWIGYFRMIETLSILKVLDSWIWLRLRCFMVKRWINNCHTRYRNLIKLGVNGRQACVAAASHKGPLAMCNMKPLKIAMSDRFFTKQGFRSYFDQYQALCKAT